jgi:hypothetical protein
MIGTLDEARQKDQAARHNPKPDENPQAKAEAAA